MIRSFLKPLPTLTRHALRSAHTLSAQLNCGIVGLPNVGKSTLFNALVGSEAAQAANFPFCTIEPNVGFVHVPDNRLNLLKEMYNSEKVLPAMVNIYFFLYFVRLTLLLSSDCYLFDNYRSSLLILQG
jgi:hypothetical protein